MIVPRAAAAPSGDTSQSSAQPSLADLLMAAAIQKQYGAPAPQPLIGRLKRREERMAPGMMPDQPDTNKLPPEYLAKPRKGEDI